MFGSRQPSDEQIIYKIRQGDEKMLVLLYKRNFETLKNLIQRNSGSVADAEDVMQESLVTFWQKVQEPGFTLTSKIDTYIYAIARNKWLKSLRKNEKLSPASFDEGDFPDAPEIQYDEQEENDQAEVLSRYMQQLSPLCRQILSYFYFEQWDMEQIAGKLRLANAQTAKAKKYQCKKKLEELIRRHYNAGDLL